MSMFLLSVDIDVIIFDFFLLSSHQILMKQCTTLYKDCYCSLQGLYPAAKSMPSDAEMSTRLFTDFWFLGS